MFLYHSTIFSWVLNGLEEEEPDVLPCFAPFHLFRFGGQYRVEVLLLDYVSLTAEEVRAEIQDIRAKTAPTPWP